jgi:tetratricopeptide (TPR) repeat protein
MKNNKFYFVVAVFLAGLIMQGFECGSPDFTGAKVQEQNKDYPGAIRLYRAELKKNPSNQEAWYRMAILYGTQMNDIAEMNAAFQEAEKISPKYSNEIKAYRTQYWVQSINNGVNYIKQVSSDSSRLDSSKYYCDKAIEQYKIAADIIPDTSLTYNYLWKAYKAKGDIDGVILYMKEEWKRSHELELYKSVGQLYVQKGKWKKDDFNSTNSENLKKQKNLSEIEKGSFKTDVSRMLGAPDNIKKDKKNTGREDWVYNQYGLLLTVEGEKVVNKKITKKMDLKIDSTKYYEAVGNFNEAVDVFEEIKKENSKDNENLNLLLQAYYEANRILEATNTFKLAVNNDPGNKMNHYILGLLERMVDDYDGAIKEFNEAIKIDPYFDDAIYDIGATYYNWGVKMKKEAVEKGDESKEYKKKFEQALPWMEKVAQIKKNDAKVWDTIGTIYALLGQSKKAEKALDEADKIRRAAK